MVYDFYDLAKGLGAAGFLQRDGRYFVVDEHGAILHCHDGHIASEQQFDPMFDYYYAPTLSELPFSPSFARTSFSLATCLIPYNYIE